MDHPRQRWLGFIEVLASGICFGFLGFFGKKAYQSGIQPGELLSFRFTISALCLGLILLLFHRKELRIPARPLVQCLSLGAFGYAVFSSCFFFALQGLSASLSVLLLYTFPVMVAVGAKVFLDEEIGRRGLIALPLATLGLIGLVWGEWHASSPLFLLWGILSAVFYSVYILLSRAWLRDQNPFVSTLYIQIGAAAVLSCLHFRSLARPLQILHQELPLILGVSLISSLFAMTLFLSGLRRISSAETSVLSTSEPMTGILVACLFLGERLKTVQLAGGALVLASMVLIALKNSSQRRFLMTPSASRGSTGATP